jgi:hypothetical protein
LAGGILFLILQEKLFRRYFRSSIPLVLFNYSRRNMNMKFQLRCAGGLLLLFALYGTSIAQTSRGTLTGIVTDSSNAVVVDATVRLTETATAVSRQTTTNGAGLYRFDAVDLGTYK